MDKIPDFMLKRISDVYYEWITTKGPDLKKAGDFIQNILDSFSNVAVQDRDGVLTPYNLKDVYRRMLGFMYHAGRLEDEEAYGNLLINNYFDINPNDVRESFNSIYAQKLKQKPTFRFANITDNPELTFFSKSLNFNLQRMLMKGDFYGAHYKRLQAKTLAEGTGYTRIEYKIKLDRKEADKSLVEFYKYKFVPVHLVFDDMMPDTLDLEDSIFVGQIHYWSRQDAEKYIKEWSNKNFKFGGVESQDYFVGNFDLMNDFDEFWNAYRVENDGFDIIELVECFWKKPDKDNARGFEWMRSFLVRDRQGYALREIPGTAKSNYACGLPLIKKKHEFSPNSRYGFTPIPDLINMAQARNVIVNQYLNRLYKDSYVKRVFSQKFKNLVDTYGNKGFQDYQDQDFITSIFNNEGVKTHMGQVPFTEVNPNLLQMIDKIKAEGEQSIMQDFPNANRTSVASLRLALEQANMKNVPWISEDEEYFVKLGTKHFEIYTTDYEEDHKQCLRKRYGTIVNGISLVQYDPKDAPADLGLEVELVDKSEGIRNLAMDNIANIVQMIGGLQNLFTPEGEVVADMFRLREIGYTLPGDKNKENCLAIIHKIVNNEITTEEELQATIIPNVDDAQVYATTILKYMVDNKDMLLKLDAKDTVTTLLTQMYYTYLDIVSGNQAPAEGEPPVDSGTEEQGMSPEELQAMEAAGIQMPAGPAQQIPGPPNPQAPPMDVAP